MPDKPNAIALWNRRSGLYASLHERLAGTEGVNELAEPQVVEEELATLAMEGYHRIIDRAENPGNYAAS